MKTPEDARAAASDGQSAKADEKNREVTLEEIAAHADPRCRSCYGAGKHRRGFGFDFRPIGTVKGRPALARVTCENDEIACGCALKRFQLKAAGKLKPDDFARIEEKLAELRPETDAAREQLALLAAAEDAAREFQAAMSIAELRSELVRRHDAQEPA